MVDVVVSNGGTSMKAALAAVSGTTGSTITVGTASGQTVTNHGSTGHGDRIGVTSTTTNLTIQGYDSTVTLQSQYSVCLKLSGMIAPTIKNIQLETTYTANNGTDGIYDPSFSFSALGPEQHGLVTFFPGELPVRNGRFENVTFRPNIVSAGAIHGNTLGQHFQFYRCYFTTARNLPAGREYAGEINTSGPACVTMINPQNHDGSGTNEVVFRECRFEHFGQKVASYGIERTFITDGHAIQVDDQQQNALNPYAPTILSDYYIIDCSFDHIGGSAINHNSMYGGNTYIVNCSAMNCARTNSIYPTNPPPTATTQTQSDRGMMIGFNYEANGAIHDIYMVNNLYYGRGTGSEKMVWIDPVDFTLSGSNNWRYGCPSTGSPAPPAGFYAGSTDPQITQEAVGTTAGDLTPLPTSPLLGAGVTGYPGIPPLAPDDLPVFNTAALPAGASWQGGHYPAIGAITPSSPLPADLIEPTGAVPSTSEIYDAIIYQGGVLGPQIVNESFIYTARIREISAADIRAYLTVTLNNPERRAIVKRS